MASGYGDILPSDDSMEAEYDFDASALLEVLEHNSAGENTGAPSNRSRAESLSSDNNVAKASATTGSRRRQGGKTKSKSSASKCHKKKSTAVTPAKANNADDEKKRKAAPSSKTKLGDKKRKAAVSSKSKPDGKKRKIAHSSKPKPDEKKSAEGVPPKGKPALFKKESSTSSDVDEEAPTKPRRPLSAYNLFFKYERARLLRLAEQGLNLADHPPCRVEVSDINALMNDNPYHVDHSNRPHRKSHGKVSFNDLFKNVLNNWKNLSPHMRAPFEEIGANNKAAYDEEARAYKIWKRREQWRKTKARSRSKKRQKKLGEKAVAVAAASGVAKNGEKDEATASRVKEMGKEGQEAEKDKETAPRKKETEKNDKETAPRKKETAQKDQQTAPRKKETEKKDQGTAPRKKETGKKDQQTAPQKETGKKGQETALRKKETEKKNQITVPRRETEREDQEIVPRKETEKKDRETAARKKKARKKSEKIGGDIPPVTQSAPPQASQQDAAQPSEEWSKDIAPAPPSGSPQAPQQDAAEPSGEGRANIAPVPPQATPPRLSLEDTAMPREDSGNEDDVVPIPLPAPPHMSWEAGETNRFEGSSEDTDMALLPLSAPLQVPRQDASEPFERSGEGSTQRPPESTRQPLPSSQPDVWTPLPAREGMLQHLTPRLSPRKVSTDAAFGGDGARGTTRWRAPRQVSAEAFEERIVECTQMTRWTLTPLLPHHHQRHAAEGPFRTSTTGEGGAYYASQWAGAPPPPPPPAHLQQDEFTPPPYSYPMSTVRHHGYERVTSYLESGFDRESFDPSVFDETPLVSNPPDGGADFYNEPPFHDQSPPRAFHSASR